MDERLSNFSSTLLLQEFSSDGTFIAVEGRDGAGKTTFVKYMQMRLEKLGYICATTKLPTNRVKQSIMFELFARQRREDLVSALAMQVFHMADRLQHSYEFITPNLSEGKIVITDRYLSASIGSIRTHQLSQNWFNELSLELWKPKIWIWLHAPADIAIARIKSRPDEKDKPIDKDEYEQALELGLEIANQYGMTILNTAELTLDDCWDALNDQLCRALSDVSRRMNY